MTRWIASLAAACALGLGAAPAAAEAPRCQKDTLGNVQCAKDPNGVALVDALGAVVCAPGRCVQAGAEWHCSIEPGGDARLEDAGRPVCAGECRAPTATECERP